MKKSYTVTYEPVKDGYQVTVPVLPGLITYGRTFAEAKVLATDAIRCHIGGLRKDVEKVPTEESLVQERIMVSV